MATHRLLAGTPAFPPTHAANNHAVATISIRDFPRASAVPPIPMGAIKAALLLPTVAGLVF